MNSILDRLDEQIAARHLLTHPFYLAWTRGELRKETLADYACQYYQHVAAFPTYLSAVHARCDDQPTRRQLLANLIDEEAGEPNHPQLWRQFAAALGVAPNDLDNAGTWPETAQLITTFRSVCSEGDLAAGLAALYAYESQIPAVSESKIDGLKKHYGFTAPESYRYFTIHIEAAREKHPAGKFRRRYGSRRGHTERALGTALRGVPPSRDRLLGDIGNSSGRPRSHRW